MKKLTLILTLLMSVCCGTMAQNDAMYVYRNDGVINAFLKTDIDSVRYSQLDLDSVLHTDYVVQEVWAVDSVYRIPIERIDSVSFVTPETVLSEGVVDIAKSMWDYVLRSEELTLILSPSIPSELIPSVGTKLVYTKMDEKFPAGFAGEVFEVFSTEEGISVVCNNVKLEDIFETFYSTTSVYGYTDDEESAGKAVLKEKDKFGEKTFRLPTIRFSQGEEISRNVLSRDLAIKGGTKYELSIAPLFRIQTSLIINKEMGVYQSTSIRGDITIRQQFDLYGGLEYKKDFLDPEVVIAPVAPFTYFYLKPGLFVDAEVDATLSATLTHRYTAAMTFNHGSKGGNVPDPTCEGRLDDCSLNVEGSIDGKIALGGFIEAGVTFVKTELDKVCVRCELGGELVGHAVLYNSDIPTLNKETKTYEKFKKSKFEFNTFVHSFAEARFGLVDLKRSLPWNLNYNIRTWDVVPTFSDVSLKKNSGYPTHVDAYAWASGDCLFPVNVGFSLFDGKKNLCETYSSERMFDNGEFNMTHTFSSTQRGNKYTVYPTVNFLGFKMLASPTAEIEIEDHSPAAHVTNFQQTSASYQKGGYSFDNYTYDYKYGLATTVAINADIDRSTVEDWGYVYADESGYSRQISLKSNSSPYTDNRNAFSNNSSGTVSMYGYIKYYDDDQYYYEEPHEYKLKYQENLTIREYLVRLYQTTDGDNWTNNNNWCTDAPVNTWYGVYEEYGYYYIHLRYNHLSGYIDVSSCTALLNLDCKGNQLTRLDVSGCTTLNWLDCDDNQITSLDVSGCTTLEWLFCNDNQITSLDVSGCTTLNWLFCNDNQITSLDVSGCTTLRDLECNNNQLTNLDVSGCTKLEEIRCYYNQLTSLDVSGCTALNWLNCKDNQLTSLDVSGCTKLKEIDCYDNQLTSLDVSGCTKLYKLSCSDNQLTSLDVSGCPELGELYGQSNQLTSLDVSGCTKLNWLDCYDNQLTSLDVSGCTKLEEIRCYDNQLTSLDVSGCTALNWLDCKDNQLTSLDASGCTALRYLSCERNHINQIIDGVFANIPDFFYDRKYDYRWDGILTNTNPYGWWYPGEPEKGRHSPD